MRMLNLLSRSSSSSGSLASSSWTGGSILGLGGGELPSSLEAMLSSFFIFTTCTSKVGVSALREKWVCLLKLKIGKDH